MRRIVGMLAVVGLICFGVNLWAADDQQPVGASAPYGEQHQQNAQEVGPTSGAGTAASGVVGYQPIPESMLPISGENPATPTSNAQPANLPVPSNYIGGPALAMGPYTLGEDDVVQIIVRGQPDFSGTFVVNHEGNIQYGLLGDIKADGLIKDQLRDVIIEKLKRYIRVPAVQVTIAGFNSKAIYILGEVARPGKYAMRGDTIKIRDALIAAGLVTTRAALKRVHVIKADPNDPTYRVLNLKKVLYKGQMKNNIDLVHGDIVVVPSTVWAKINTFLNELLSPATKAGSVASLAVL